MNKNKISDYYEEKEETKSRKTIEIQAKTSTATHSDKMKSRKSSSW